MSSHQYDDLTHAIATVAHWYICKWFENIKLYTNITFYDFMYEYPTISAEISCGSSSDIACVYNINQIIPTV